MGQAIRVAKNQVSVAPIEMHACQNNPIGMKPNTRVRLVQNQLSWWRMSSNTTRAVMIIAPDVLELPEEWVG